MPTTPSAGSPSSAGLVIRALFGSVLRGQPRVDSDVNVLVEFVPGAKTYTQFLALTNLLEQRLGRRVELVTREALSPFIGPRILAEASDVLEPRDYLHHILVEAAPAPG